MYKRQVVDSKDLYSSLSTQRQSIDKSIRGDVSMIRYYFETGVLSQVVWIPGKVNLADVGTKPDSPLTTALQHCLASGTLPFDFEKSEARSTDLPLG